MSKKKPKIHVADEKEIGKYGKSGESAREGAPAVEDAETADQGDQSAATEAASAEQPRAELEQWKDKLLRAKADYRNLAARSEKDKNEAIRFANADFARSLLTILDDFERTFEAGKCAESAEPVIDGLRIIYDHFMKLLKDHGVEPIEAEGKTFDPFEHEALGQEPSEEHPAGAVAVVRQRGYRMHERVLRPARVVVSSGSAAEQAEEGQADQEREGSQGQDDGE